MAYEVTRLPGGLSTANLSTTFQSCIIPGPVTVQQYVQDFNTYASSDYVVSTTNSSSATVTAANGAGGLVVLAEGAASVANDIVQIQLATAGFNLDAANKPFWIETKFQVNDVSNTIITIGLQTVNTDGSASGNGIFFSKPNGSNIVACIEKLNGVATTVGSTTASGTVALHFSDHLIATSLVNNTMITLGMSYGQHSRKSIFYVNNLEFAGIDSNTTIPNNLNLAPIISLKNGATGNKALTVDYLAFVVAR